jgi:hypothetical protein
MIIFMCSDGFGFSSPRWGEEKQWNFDSNKVDRALSAIPTAGKPLLRQTTVLTIT